MIFENGNVIFIKLLQRGGGGKERSIVGVRAPYMRVVGMQVDQGGAGKATSLPVTSEEEDLFRRLAASTNIYERISESIAPSIFGSADIKKAIACLLFGGQFCVLRKLQLFAILAVLFPVLRY